MNAQNTDSDLENRNQLTQAVKDFRHWRLLKDAAKYGFLRLPKSHEAADMVINSPFVEVVEHKDYMTQNIRFDSVESKEKFLDGFYFIKLTDMGIVALAMYEKQHEQLSAIANKYLQETQELKQNIASKLLAVIGLGDITVSIDDF